MMKIAFVIGIVLAVFAVSAMSAAAEVRVYFDPDPSTISLATGENVTIQVKADVGANESGIKSWQICVDFDRSVINITNVENPCKTAFGGTCYAWQWCQAGWSHWECDGACQEGYEHPPYGAFVWGIGVNGDCYTSPVTVYNLTIEGVSGGITPIEFTHTIRHEPTIGSSRVNTCTPESLPSENITWVDSEIEIGSVPVIFAKDLIEGWNLISLPLTPIDNNNSTSTVLSSISGKYDAVFRMDPRIGYFVNVTTAGTWSYTGRHTSISVDLKPGLNCIGWGNTSEDISDALSPISDNYIYVARWGTNDPKYEVYGVNAPLEFIDFETMERGNGYWIAAKGDCTLNVR